MNRPVVCAVGTTDPWNAAGLGLDVWALAECGARAVIVVAGISAQDERGVNAALAVPAELVRAQFAALEHAAIAAYRIGALLDAQSVVAVAEHMATTTAPVVYDPVFAPTAGGAFADAPLVREIVARLLPHVTVVTPNLTEIAQLLATPVPETVAAMSVAARALQAKGPRAVLVTGGHLEGVAATDVLFDGATRVFEDPRIDATLRGTGCLLADALAAALARGVELGAAISEARAFVRRKLRGGVQHGPMRTAY